MRHYTYEWIQAGWEPWTVRDEAEAYFRSISHRLSASVHEFRQAVNLHDARLQRLSFAAGSDSVSLEINELYWNDTLHHGCRRPLILTYTGQTSVELSGGPADRNNRYPLQDDDVLLDEWDAEGSHLEHRMLFASGAELHVKFLHFTFHHPASGSIPAGDGDTSSPASDTA